MRAKIGVRRGGVHERRVRGGAHASSTYATTFNPTSLYKGALTAIVIIVVWFYYAALIFILGGEVGQVYELRRVRRQQREMSPRLTGEVCVMARGMSRPPYFPR